MITFNDGTDESVDKFTYLYKEYRNMVFKTIFGFVKDHHLSEDLLQEVYILIGKHLEKVDPSNHRVCKNWIFTITRNYCKSYFRKKDRIKEDCVENCDILESEIPGALDHVIKTEQLNEIMSAIHQLDDKYTIPFELKYICGFCDDDIASFLGIAKKTAQMRLYRAKQMLRKRLEGI